MLVESNDLFSKDIQFSKLIRFVIFKGFELAPGIDAKSGEAEFAVLVSKILNHKCHHLLPQPSGLKVTLYEHQIEGFSWLATMSKIGLGIILADEMGLGKTLQIISFLLQNIHQAKLSLPTLIVCPTSVIPVWTEAFRKYAPAIKYWVHDGPDRYRLNSELSNRIKQFHVVIASYTTICRDQEILTDIQWDGAILDEAQKIKDPRSTTYVTCLDLKAEYRIAVTGTPIENHVGDLWTIMNFLNPGLLGTKAQFEDRYMRGIQKRQDSESAELLKKRIAPFILRRAKKECLDLPEKITSILPCLLTKNQVAQYNLAAR